MHIEQKREMLQLIDSLPQDTAMIGAVLLLDLLRAWAAESADYTEAVHLMSSKLSIDTKIVQACIRYPEMVDLMQRLWEGTSPKELKVSCKTGKRHSWYAWLVLNVIKKSGGVISHVRLLRWLGHRATAQEVREGLNKLCEANVIETYQAAGRDPLRPVTYHRLMSEDKSSERQPA